MSIECLERALDTDDLPTARAELKHVKRERELLHAMLNTLGDKLEQQNGESLPAALDRVRREVGNAALEGAARLAWDYGNNAGVTATSMETSIMRTKWHGVRDAMFDLASAIRVKKVAP